MSIDNAPGGEDYEDYQRGDLSGIVYDISREGMARVRFLEHGSMTVNIVVKADGTLGIDPSGIPRRRPTPPARPAIAPGTSDESIICGLCGTYKAGSHEVCQNCGRLDRPPIRGELEP